MLPKRIARIGCSFLQVLREVQLFAQGPPALDLLRLTPFPLPDFSRNGKQVVGLFYADKQTAVFIGEHRVIRSDDEISTPRGVQRQRIAGIEAPWTGGASAVAENWQTNFPQLRRVAVCAPHNDSSQIAVLSLERGQIADAAFVQSAAIVDDQNIPGPRG